MVDIWSLLLPSLEHSPPWGTDVGAKPERMGFHWRCRGTTHQETLPADSFQNNCPSHMLTRLSSCVEESGGRKHFAVSSHINHEWQNIQKCRVGHRRQGARRNWFLPQTLIASAVLVTCVVFPLHYSLAISGMGSLNMMLAWTTSLRERSVQGDSSLVLRHEFTRVLWIPAVRKPWLL